MQRFFTTIGRGLAWGGVALTYLTTGWGALVTAALTALAAYWLVLSAWLTSPPVYIACIVFVLCLWTIIGIHSAFHLNRPRHVIVSGPLEHCISIEGFQIFINPEGGDNALQIGCNFRNMWSGAIRIEVEEFNLTIEDRFLPEAERKVSMTIPRLSARGIRSGFFKQEVIKQKMVGNLKLIVLYGKIDELFSRSYTLRSKLYLGIQQSAGGQIIAVGLADEFLSESDVPIL